MLQAQPVDVPPPAHRLHRGRWTYEAAPKGSWSAGQFLYAAVSPRKRCLQNLTIQLLPIACMMGLGPEAFEREWCVPQSLEGPAVAADLANEDASSLNDTCIQLAANLSPDPSDDLAEAVSKRPTKHGYVGAGISRASIDYSVAFGLPAVEADWPGLYSTVPRTLFALLNLSGVLTTVMRDLFPSELLAVVQERSTQDTVPAISKIARSLNRTVQVEVLADDFGAAREVAAGLLGRARRYILLLGDSASAARFVCALDLENLLGYVQVVASVAAADLSEPSLVRATPCGGRAGYLERVRSAGGLLGMAAAPYAPAGLGALLRQGSDAAAPPQDGLGRPWPLVQAGAAAQAAAAAALHGCADDPQRANSSALLRTALGVEAGSTLSCAEAAPLGQSLLACREVAGACPVASCQYNLRSPACRMSCACSWTPGCAPAAWADLSESPAGELRCEGVACRDTDFAASGRAEAEVLLDYAFSGTGFCPAPWDCPPLQRSLVATRVGIPTQDATWALIEAYRCVEREQGSQGLQRLAASEYRTRDASTTLVQCLRRVQFEGSAGRIAFSGGQAACAGAVPILLQEPSPAAGHATTVGMVFERAGAARLLLAARTFHRARDTSGCTAAAHDGPPGLLCADGFAAAYSLDRDGDLEAGGRKAWPLGSPSSCPAGSYPLAYGELGDAADPHFLAVFACAPCPAGTAKAEAGPSRCSPCPAGFAAPAGQPTCTACPADTWSAGVAPSRQLPDGRVQRFGPSTCAACAPGTSSTPGSPACAACWPGTCREEGGAGCAACPADHFQDRTGASNCTACDAVLPGSRAPSGGAGPDVCRCPAGTRPDPGGHCAACGEGVRCGGGTAAALQELGYWVQATDQGELRVLRCREPAECPAGPPGTCADGREGTTCSRCQQGRFSVDTAEIGGCQACTPGDAAVPVLTALAALVCALLLAASCFGHLPEQSLSFLTLTTVLGQIVTIVQSLSAFQDLQIQWMEPIHSTLRVLSVLTLNLDVVRMSCLLGKDDALTRLIVRLFALPCLLAALYGIAGLEQALAGRRGKRAILRAESLANVTGLLTLLIFIPLLMASTQAFRCAAHPDGSSRLASDPGVLCWASQEHKVLLALSVLGILGFPATILAVVVRATLLYESWLHSGEGLRTLRYYRFLFANFTPVRYKFPLVYLVRNTAIAIIPTALLFEPMLEVLIMNAVVLAGVCVQLCWWPWRTKLGNKASILTSTSLTMFLTAAAFLIHTERAKAERILQSLFFVSISLILLAMAHGTALACRSRFWKAKPFAIFLCHHKSGAGVLCRFLQLVLANRLKTDVFLDADHLEELEALVDTVWSKSKSFVAVVTELLLQRVWCAAEIVSAHVHGVRSVRLLCEPCGPMPEVEEATVATWWPPDQVAAVLTPHGISVQMVVAAYAWLAGLPGVRLNRFGSLPAKLAGVKSLLRACGLRAVTRSSFLISERTVPDAGAPDGDDALVATTSSGRSDYSSRHATGSASVVVLGATAVAEGLSCCEVVALMLQAMLQVEVAVVREQSGMLQVAPDMQHAVVLLSEGLLDDHEFARTLLAVAPAKVGAGLELVSILTDERFTFPDTAFYSRLETEGLGTLSGSEVASAYRALFSVLSLPLSPLGSYTLIERQLGEVVQRRFRREREWAASSPTSRRLRRSVGSVSLDDLAGEALDVAVAMCSSSPTSTEATGTGPVSRSESVDDLN